MKKSRRTAVYIDGLNFYYRAARPHNIKWINLYDLCKNKLDETNEIVQIKYFTSMIGRSSSDPRKQFRQRVYIRALRTIKNLEIIKGTFKVEQDLRTLACDPSRKVKVILPEEKGSDVNLAVHMVNDAHLDKYDIAVVLSNDSDLKEAIKIVKAMDNKLVGIICPASHVTNPLKRSASFCKMLKKEDLRDAEFPKTLTDGQGKFHRPKEW